MGRAIGSTVKNFHAPSRNGRQKDLRDAEGRFTDLERIRNGLRERVGVRLQRLEWLAEHAESEQVQLDANKYLTNQAIGSPVETTKVQQLEPVEAPEIIISSLIPEKGEQIVKDDEHVSH